MPSICHQGTSNSAAAVLKIFMELSSTGRDKYHFPLEASLVHSPNDACAKLNIGPFSSERERGLIIQMYVIMPIDSIV